MSTQFSGKHEFYPARSVTQITSGTFAARPAFGVADRYYWATDLGVLYRDTGAAWEIVASDDSMLAWGHPVAVAGDYYQPIYVGNIAGAMNTVADRLQATWLPLRRRTTFDGIAFGLRVNGPGGARARLGVYADDGNFNPGALLLDAGEVIADAGAQALREIVIDLTLNPGSYWLAYNCNAVIGSFLSTWGNLTPKLVHPGPSGIGSYVNASMPYNNIAYAALPDPFGGIDGYDTNSPSAVTLHVGAIVE